MGKQKWNLTQVRDSQSARGASVTQFFRMTHRFGVETFYELLREPEQLGGDWQVDAETNRGTKMCREPDIPKWKPEISTRMRSNSLTELRFSRSEMSIKKGRVGKRDWNIKEKLFMFRVIAPSSPGKTNKMAKRKSNCPVQRKRKKWSHNWSAPSDVLVQPELARGDQ